MEARAEHAGVACSRSTPLNVDSLELADWQGSACRVCDWYLQKVVSPA